MWLTIIDNYTAFYFGMRLLLFVTSVTLSSFAVFIQCLCCRKRKNAQYRNRVVTRARTTRKLLPKGGVITETAVRRTNLEEVVQRRQEKSSMAKMSKAAKEMADIHLSREPLKPRTFDLGHKEKRIKKEHVTLPAAKKGDNDPYPTITLKLSVSEQSMR